MLLIINKFEKISQIMKVSLIFSTFLTILLTILCLILYLYIYLPSKNNIITDNCRIIHIQLEPSTILWTLQPITQNWNDTII